MTSAAPPPRRLALMWALLALIALLLPVLIVVGYYAVAKLTYTAYACGSFARLDPELGWTLRPSASSCVGARPPLRFGAPWFEVPVFTDRNGFRSLSPGAETPRGALMFAGDSYTFGYGVGGQESFAEIVGQRLATPIVNLGVPAYSSAQGLLLAERWAPVLRPRAIVFLEAGQWQRAGCRGPRRPTAIVKPCYWQPPGQAVGGLVLPPAGRVERWARFGLLPGGIVGAGETTWRYFLVSRPLSLGLQGLARLGIVPGFANDFAPVGVDDTAMRRGVVAHLGRLAAAAGVPVILLDPLEQYPAAMIEALPAQQRARIHRIGKAQWDREVTARAIALAPEQRIIPHDGHYGAGMHALIGEFLAGEFRALGLAGESR